MFFTKLARVLAWFLLVIGIFQLATTSYFVVFLPVEQADFLIKRYYGTHTAGHVIDRSALMILAAIVLGTFAEISRAIQNKH